MKQTWNTFGKDSIQIDFAKKWDAESHYQIVVADFDKRAKLEKLLADRPVALKQFQKELKELDSKSKSSDKSDSKKQDLKKSEIKSICLNFDGDGFFKLILVQGKPSTYNLHQEIRSNLGDALHPSTTEYKFASLNLEFLSNEHQVTVLDACVNLIGLNYFRPETYGEKKKEVKEFHKFGLQITTTLQSKKANSIADRALIVANAMNHMRYLADLPGNELRPSHYRKHVEEVAKAHAAEFKFLGTKELKAKKAEAFLAVVAADPNNQGGIAILKSKKKAKKKIVLVGKGLCFDTGGYNVKTSHMEDMHRDMTGSAVALAVFQAIQELNLNVQVEVYLALAENLISETAYKPNDVVTACNGVSIEVIDTDAEGRMVLSDTLAIASESKPDLILDYATLTGAAIRAIDTRRSAVFSTDIKLAARAVDAGDKAGERVWYFPIGDDYNESLKSDVADVRQCAATNNCDHIYAATFLSKFVQKNTPWIHVDLVSAENKGGLGLAKTNTTGFGVRLSLEIIESELL